MDSRVLRFSVASFLFAFILLLSGCSSDNTIVHSLPEKEANQIIVLLAGEGISSTKEAAASSGAGAQGPQLWDINVSGSDVVRALSVLQRAGLPRNPPLSLLDSFSSGGMVSSETEETIKYQQGLAGELASTIQKIDGILDASVQLSIPKKDPLNPQAQVAPVTASVWVKHQGVLDNPNSQLYTKIRRLVASAIPDLSYENVTVVGVRGAFTDVAVDPGKKAGTLTSQTGIPLVNVWGIVVAQSSVSSMRWVFFVLIAFVFILSIALAWTLWKIYPVLRHPNVIKLITDWRPLKVEFPDHSKEGKPEENEEDSGEAEEAPQA